MTAFIRRAALSAACALLGAATLPSAQAAVSPQHRDVPDEVCR